MARYEAEQTLHLSLLKRHLAEKKRLLSEVRSRKVLDRGAAQVIRAYWQQVLRIISGIEQVSAAKDFAVDVQRDIETLQNLRASLETRRDQPETEQQLDLVHSLLAVLQVVLGQTKKRAKEIADARFAWLFAVNPAKPKKADKGKQKQREKLRQSARSTMELGELSSEEQTQQEAPIGERQAPEHNRDKKPNR